MDSDTLDRYSDQWAAIQDDGVVIASAADLDGLLSILRDRPDARASIQRIPARGEPLFVGLR